MNTHKHPPEHMNLIFCSIFFSHLTVKNQIGYIMCVGFFNDDSSHMELCIIWPNGYNWPTLFAGPSKSCLMSDYTAQRTDVYLSAMMFDML